MAKFAYNETNKILLDILHSVLVELITDASWDVRKTIAYAMHEVSVLMVVCEERFEISFQYCI